jgi:3,4-dihydroxy 2-butanone 4-phosphate synthase/GTP cyclohydrolase II
MGLSTIPEAIEDIKAGKFIIIVDDEDRENEGDLSMAAEMVTPEAINFMAKHARGLICMPVIGKRLDELNIPMMVQHNTAKYGTAFTVSVEAKNRTSTGISAVTAVSWSGRGRPRRLSTLPGWLDSIRRVLSARL